MASIIRATTTSGLQVAPDNSGSLQLQTNGTTTAVTIDTSQNVGIGTTSPSYKLDVVGGINASGNVSTASGNFVLGTNDTYLGFASNNIKFNNTSDRITMTTGASERMRIDTSGVVMINQTSNTSTSARFAVTGNCASENIRTVVDSGTTYGSNNNYDVFWNSTFGVAGKISHTAVTTTAYTTTSDYRLKTDVKPMIGAIDKIALLKPVTYTWTEDKSSGQGFIAHELQEIFPEAVVGEKDATRILKKDNEDGTITEEVVPDYQTVDTSFLVATLTAAIQEQQTIINDLKARIETLEAK